MAPVTSSSRVRRRAVPALAIFAGSVFVERWGIGLPFFLRHYAEDVVDVFGFAGVVSWIVLPLYHRKKPPRA